MNEPRLFMGGGGTLLEADRGYTDGGAAYELCVQTNPIAPAGVGGEAIFTTAYVVLTFSGPFQIRITPILDGIPLWDEATTLAGASVLTERQTHRFEIAMLQTLYRDGVAKYRHSLRGTWFALLIEMPCPATDDTDLILEGAQIDVEIVSQGKV